VREREEKSGGEEKTRHEYKFGKED